MVVKQICFCWSENPKSGEQISKCIIHFLAPCMLMRLSKYRLEILLISHSMSIWPTFKSSLALKIPLELDLDKSKGILNIFHVFIPHETITFDDRESLWITERVKQIAPEKNKMYKKLLWTLPSRQLHVQS